MQAQKVSDTAATAIQLSLRIRHPDIDPDGISAALGLEPEHCFRAGEPRAANRDERRYSNPDRFDIDRDARDQLCWGTGAHMCAGMHLARLEMEVMLEALVEADVSMVAGVPAVGTNRGLFGYLNLPFRLDSAGRGPSTIGSDPSSGALGCS